MHRECNSHFYLMLSALNVHYTKQNKVVRSLYLSVAKLSCNRLNVKEFGLFRPYFTIDP